MLYPESERQTSWIAMDPDCPVLCKEIQIPYFPKPGELVQTRNGQWQQTHIYLCVTVGNLKLVKHVGKVSQKN